ncbi:MAG TPA: glycosyltransferase family 4 protein [Chitinophagales bacterium]|nr:glycosyltransferase family 4 protein [Chitinophagales bacterium]
MSNKKVLIFTYYFPPAGGVAVQRFLKFSKYLPQFGWEPIIVTVKNGSYPYYDESLLNELSPELKVYRTDTFEPFELYNLLKGKKGKAMPVVSVGAQQKRSLFQRLSEYVRANYFIPDARKGWVPYAVKQAEEIIKEHTIDAVITTGPPHSTHLIGLQLKKKYGIKWVADFRDPWTGIFYNNILPRTESSKQKDKALETVVLQTADLVTVISPGMKKEFETRAKAIEVVMNGYDEQDFEKPIQPGNSSVFTIRYVGNLMASQNAPGLWSALKQLKQEGYQYKLEFIGRVDEPIKESIAINGLADNSTYVDFVKHQQAIELMQQAHLLLFAIPDVKDNALILTGKLFEYLASKSNIISYGPVNGNAAEILQNTGRKNMIDFADTNESYNQLKTALDYYAIHKQGYKYNNGAEKVYSRKNQAGLLSGLLNKL